jgi:outer membrane protein TolC
MTSIAALALALGLAQAEGGTPEPPAAQPPAAQAQSPLPPLPDVDDPSLFKAAGPILTLEEVLAAAAKANLDLRVARARLAQAETASAQAWSGYLPRVTASGTYTRFEEAVVIPFGGEEIELQRQDQLNGQIEATQALLAPQLFFAIPNANRFEKVATLGTEGARRDILFGAAQAYYSVASLRQLVEASGRLLEIARRQERDAQIRLRAGTIARVGLVRAEIDRARAEQDVRRARNSYLSAKIALAALLDRDDLSFEVADPPEVQLPEDPAALEQRALRDRTDVQAASLSVEIARGEKSAVIARYLPSVGAFFRWNVSNTGGLTGQNEFWTAGAALQWDLLDGGLREAQVREASARIAEQEAALAKTRRDALTEVRQALLDWQSARANAIKAREQRELAAENQRLVDVSYRAGAATALEQADATTELRNAEIASQTESLLAQVAGLRVLQAAGAVGPLEPAAAAR